jgi:hypothetical protein
VKEDTVWTTAQLQGRVTAMLDLNMDLHISGEEKEAVRTAVARQ